MKNTYIRPITTVMACDMQALLDASQNRVRQNDTKTLISGYSVGGDGTDMSKKNDVWEAWEE